jgi:hypothetical protein
MLIINAGFSPFDCAPRAISENLAADWREIGRLKGVDKTQIKIGKS